MERRAAETRARASGPDLADVALGHGRRRGRGGGGVGVREERHALVLPGELVGGVHLLVAGDAERGLVRAAQHPRLGGPARVALDLHQGFRGRGTRTAARGRGGSMGLGTWDWIGLPFFSRLPRTARVSYRELLSEGEGRYMAARSECAVVF